MAEREQKRQQLELEKKQREAEEAQKQLEIDKQEAKKRGMTLEEYHKYCESDDFINDLLKSIGDDNDSR